MQTRAGLTSWGFFLSSLSNLWPRRVHRSQTAGRKGSCGGEAGLRQTQEVGEEFAAALEASVWQKMFFFSGLQLIDVSSCEKHTVWTASRCLYYTGTPYVFLGRVLKKGRITV